MANEPKPELRRCPNCGASDLTLNTELGKIQCRHCKNVFDGKLADDVEGAEDILETESLVAFSCSSCGAEVVLNADENTSAQCHWCKHIFSLNEKIMNGAVPDLVLPFKISRQEAMGKISERVRAMPNDYYDADFMAQFDVEKTVGVYFPYFILDEKAHVKFSGHGEYTEVGTVQDINNKYRVLSEGVEREFDLLIDDLTIESSSKRLKQESLIDTNNVINSILPFDVENAVEWDANYVRGFSCERRDTNVDDIDEIADLQIRDLARIQLRSTITKYTRGVRWEKEEVTPIEKKWKTAYLPVWLYSYQEPETKHIYYLVVNGRTGELAGVVPKADVQRFHKPTTNKIGGAITALGVLAIGSIIEIGSPMLMIVGMVLFALGIVVMTASQLNTETYAVRAESLGIRHGHEAETKFKIDNLKENNTEHKEIRVDDRYSIEGRNDASIYGSLSSSQVQKVQKNIKSRGGNKNGK